MDANESSAQWIRFGREKNLDRALSRDRDREASPAETGIVKAFEQHSGWVPACIAACSSWLRTLNGWHAWHFHPQDLIQRVVAVRPDTSVVLGGDKTPPIVLATELPLYEAMVDPDPFVPPSYGRPRICDFVILGLERPLIIEIDGSQHLLKRERSNDVGVDRIAVAARCDVVRFMTWELKLAASVLGYVDAAIDHRKLELACACETDEIESALFEHETRASSARLELIEAGDALAETLKRQAEFIKRLMAENATLRQRSTAFVDT